MFSLFRRPWYCFRAASVPPRGTKRKWLYWIPIGIVLSQDYLQLKQISGRSMQPTLNPESSLWKDIAIFDRFMVYYGRPYKRGDIVTLRCPEDADRILIKRICAVAGDTVKTLPPFPIAEVKIPEGQVWVEGDDSFNSDDSNIYGPIPLGLVESRMCMIIWPLDRFGSIRKPKIPLERYGPTYRHAMADIEREQARNARVTVPNDYGSG